VLRWSESLEFERDLLSFVPIWIWFPSLPLKLWSKNIISRSASLIGNPLFMDKATAAEVRIAYARCFVEIRADKELQKKVSL